MNPFVEISEPVPNIIVYKFTSVLVTDKMVDDYLETLGKQISEVTEPIVLISDVSESQVLSSKHRIKIANFIKSHSDVLKKNVMALVYVMPSPILQFVLNAIYVINRPPVKYKVVSRFEHAISWSKKKLEKLKVLD